MRIHQLVKALRKLHVHQKLAKSDLEHELRYVREEDTENVGELMPYT